MNCTALPTNAQQIKSHSFGDMEIGEEATVGCLTIKRTAKGYTITTEAGTKVRGSDAGRAQAAAHQLAQWFDRQGA